MTRLQLVAVMVACTGWACGDDEGRGPVDASDTSSPASLVIAAGAVDFGTIVEGVASPARAVVVKNDGDRDSGALAITLGGPDEDAFVVGNTTCGESLAGRSSCVLVVTFRPTHSGPSSATLEVGAEPGGAASVALEGEGLAPGALTIDVSGEDLGAVVVGRTGSTRATLSVTNTGQVESGSLRVSGGSADFMVEDGCDGEVLAAGAGCSIEVAFAPRSAGDKTLTLIVSALPGGRVSGVVRGVGLAPARLAQTESLAFGEVVVGASARGEVIVTNTGGGASGPLEIGVGGLDASAFGADGCQGVVLGGGEACSVTVAFTPDAVGPRSARLTVKGDPGGEVVTALAGAGIATALALSPGEAAFAPTRVGENSALRFSVENVGERATGAIAIGFEGDGAGHFGVVPETDRCSGVSLAAGERCAFEVVFEPASGGEATAVVRVTSPEGGGAAAALEGVGLLPAELLVRPAAIDFGALAVGYATEVRELVVENVGDERSGLLDFGLSGTGADAFTIVSDTCFTRLQPGQRCLVRVRFEPRAIEVATALLEIGATPGGRAAATLEGEGVDPDQLRIAPASSTYPELLFGERVERSFVLTNDSAAPTAVIAVLRSGDGATDFSVQDDCAALAPHASCTVVVAFEPRRAGLRAATITASAYPGGVVSATVSGVGRARVALSGSDGSALEGPLDFGDVVVGTSLPRELEVGVTNQTPNEAPLTVTPSFPAPAQFGVVGGTCGATLAAGARCTVRLRFLPTRHGPQSGTVAFAFGAAPFESAVLTVTGTGIDSLTLAAVEGTDFGHVPINTTSEPLRFRVTNAPGAPTSGRLAVEVGGPGLRVAEDGCTNRRLAAFETCTFAMTFSPIEIGTFAGIVEVSASPGGTAMLVLDGLGVPPIGARPSAVTLTPASVLENQPIGTTVGTLATVDADRGQTYRYELLLGVGFSLEGATLKTRLVLDREATPSRTIRVLVTDSGGQMLQQDITISIANVDEPMVLADDSFAVVEDAPPTSIAVLANDFDPDTALAITAVTQPAAGTVVIGPGGATLAYTPRPNACNTPPGTALDTFTYTVNNAASARVWVIVSCVDDPGVARDDTAIAAAGGPATAIPVLANDTDVDGNTRIITVTQPDEGIVVITGGGTGLTYQAAADPTEPTEVFTYTLLGGSIGTVTVDIDECAADNGGCVGDGVNCINGPGGFDCEYTIGCAACVDVACGPDGGNAPCPATTVCTDPTGPGGVCVCGPGYEEMDVGGCADIDECVRDLADVPLDATCVNTDGGWTYECPDGTEISDDESACIGE